MMNDNLVAGKEERSSSYPAGYPLSSVWAASGFLGFGRYLGTTGATCFGQV